MSNWPQNIDYGHSNWTGVLPRTSRTKQPGWMQYDGRGGYARNSGRIPARAAIWAAVAAIVFFAIAYVGAAVGLS